MGGRTRFCALVVLAFAVAPPGLRAELTIQDPGTYVVDRAGVIDAGIKASLVVIGTLNGWTRL